MPSSEVKYELFSDKKGHRDHDLCQNQNNAFN